MNDCGPASDTLQKLWVEIASLRGRLAIAKRNEEKQWRSGYWTGKKEGVAMGCADLAVRHSLLCDIDAEQRACELLHSQQEKP